MRRGRREEEGVHIWVTGIDTVLWSHAVWMMWGIAEFACVWQRRGRDSERGEGLMMCVWYVKRVCAASKHMACSFMGVKVHL